MTELERMLKETLLALERELSDTQVRQGRQISDQQGRLEAQDRHIQELRLAIRQLQTQQQESARHLQHLSDASRNLEPLLTRLRNLLEG